MEHGKKAAYYKQIEINGTSYKIGSLIVTNTEQSEEEFGEIIKIIEVNGDIFFHLKIYEEIVFDDHCHAYIVNLKSKEKKFIKYMELLVVTPCLSMKKNYVHNISTRYGL